MPPPKHLMPLPPAPPPLRPATDPVLAGGVAATTLFATLIGGPLWGGFVACVAGLGLYAHAQQLRGLSYNRVQQENLSHFLHGAGLPEDLAKIKGAPDVANQELYTFLEAIKSQYGAESVRGTGRLAGEDQLEAVSPGVTLTLAHDLGYWYAKLVFSGDTGRQFLNGEFTQWRARGRTPAEAVEAVLKRCGASRQQKMIQEYAAKLVKDSE